MTRFLNTSTGKFVWHNQPSDISYAILSHTWRPEDKGGEQSYNDIRELQLVVEQLRNGAAMIHIPSSHPMPNKVDTTLPTIFTHPDLSDKIRGICKVALEAGYELIWIDSCCIDKTSSAELSEAINSMFEWYRLADVCYVYLEDVTDDDDPRRGYAFRRSRWHTRGWTLQELIAPERVEFLTLTWKRLGTRMSLASTLEEITGIGFDILTGRATVHSASVARRMAWAAMRETTRLEDHAYSLMGIFGVHMSPIYGEGTNAFLRLQEEIIKTIPDQSVFTWGRTCTVVSTSELSSTWHGGGDSAPGLLAASPSDFEEARDVISLSPTAFARRLGRSVADGPPLHCVFTPQGVRVQFLCMDLTSIPRVNDTLTAWSLCAECMSLGWTHALALLPCEDKDGSLITLPMYRPTLVKEGDQHGVIQIGTHRQLETHMHLEPFRTVRLTRDTLKSALKHLSPIPITVSLLHHVFKTPLPKSRLVLRASRPYRDLSFWPGSGGEGAVFHIAPRSIEDLRAVGFAASPLECERQEKEVIVTFTLSSTSETQGTSRGASRDSSLLRVTLHLKEESFGGIGVRFYVAHYMTPSNAHDILLTPVHRVPCQTHPSIPNAHLQVPGDNGERLVEYFNPSLPPTRVLAEAQFVIHADTAWDAPAIDLILLRIGLESPPRKPGTADCKAFHVFVEMSERFGYTRPLIGTRGGSQAELASCEELSSYTAPTPLPSENDVAARLGGGDVQSVYQLSKISTKPETDIVGPSPGYSGGLRDEARDSVLDSKAGPRKRRRADSLEGGASCASRVTKASRGMGFPRPTPSFYATSIVLPDSVSDLSPASTTIACAPGASLLADVLEGDDYGMVEPKFRPQLPTSSGTAPPT